MHPWIERRIFPGAYPPSLAEMMQIFEPWNLSVLDIENLRLHYARTLEHWWAAFERARDRVAAMYDEKFVRMWRLYLAGSVAAFSTRKHRSAARRLAHPARPAIARHALVYPPYRARPLVPARPPAGAAGPGGLKRAHQH